MERTQLKIIEGYQGQIDQATRLRHGKGAYRFQNKYFLFEGNYEMGKKQGPGKLIFGDGRVISGQFINGELQGSAIINYPDGSSYIGDLHEGQKHGKGVYNSEFEKYDGGWVSNSKHGQGNYQDKSLDITIKGQFQHDKPNGFCTMIKWNYEYSGQMVNGLQQGQGKAINKSQGDTNQLYDQPYRYEGQYKNGLFHGNGYYESLSSRYVYRGVFVQGKPALSPNLLRLSANSQSIPEAMAVVGSCIEYQLEGQPLNLTIQAIYQGPQVLDEVQPTQEQIDKMIKDWQNQNKKNKNPPPMPDFNKPRMKIPQAIVVNQEQGRLIEIQLYSEGSQQPMRVDYRSEIAQIKLKNAQIRQEAAKKAEQDTTKKGGKKDAKNELQLKVNAFRPPQKKKQCKISILTEQQTVLKGYELPDDFPVGKYSLVFKSVNIPSLSKELIVKSKQPPKKK